MSVHVSPSAPETKADPHGFLENHALLENKAARPASDAEVGAAMGELSRAFEAFKETNDGRLAELEGRRSGDVLTEEKLARIDAALDSTRTRLDRLTLDGRRPPLGGDGPTRPDPASVEHKAAFDLYVRAGESGGLKRLEEKALSAGSGPDGGYLVPQAIERDVLKRLANLSPIRALATVRTISGGLYKRAVSTTDAVSGWVAETAARPQTDAPSLSELSFPAMELYAMPAATQTLLDDAIVDIDAWLADEVETAFAEQESVAFVTGNGVSRPRGFLSVDNVENSAWSTGQARLRRHGRGGGLPQRQPVRRAVRPRLCPAGRLPPERQLRDEPQGPEHDPQDEGCRRQLPVAAAGLGRQDRDPPRLPRGRGRGDAGCRGQQPVHRLR